MRTIHSLLTRPSRRDLLRTMGGAALMGIPFAGHTPVWSQAACAVIGSPTLTEGPYFVDEDLNRSDIRLDPSDGSMQPGVPLSVTILRQSRRLSDCWPLKGAFSQSG